jgi:hypothetical protein
MPIEMMTAEQRLREVIALRVPDHVPVAPMIYHFAASYAQISIYELWSDPEKYSFAIEECFRELGPRDIYFRINPLNPSAYVFALPVTAKFPWVDPPLRFRPAVHRGGTHHSRYHDALDNVTPADMYSER